MTLGDNPTLLLQDLRAVLAQLAEPVTFERIRSWQRACKSSRYGVLDLLPRLALDLQPARLGHERGNDELMQPLKRVARTFAGKQVGGFVGLGILSRMTRQPRYRETQQHRALAASHLRHRACGQICGFIWIRAIAVQDRKMSKRAQVGGDIPTRCLQRR